MFSVHFVHFFQFWYHVPRKIWQPCCRPDRPNKKFHLLNSETRCFHHKRTKLKQNFFAAFFFFSKVLPIFFSTRTPPGCVSFMDCGKLDLCVFPEKKSSRRKKVKKRSKTIFLFASMFVTISKRKIKNLIHFFRFCGRPPF
jgi:hypothetical protein